MTQSNPFPPVYDTEPIYYTLLDKYLALIEGEGVIDLELIMSSEELEQVDFQITIESIQKETRGK